MTTTVKDGWEDDEEGWSFDDSDSELNHLSNINSIENECGEDSFPSAEPQNLNKHVYRCTGVANTAINNDQDPVKARSQVVADDLSNYINELQNVPALIQKLNDEFRNKTNTTKVAEELIQYYSSRPKLKSYTLQTELPRMQYTVYPDQHSSALTETTSIQARYLKEDSQVRKSTATIDRNSHHEDMIWCAANQSLLSDIIAVLTHMRPNPLIRMDLLITAMAQHCHFILFFNKSLPHHNTLHCTCELSLQIPNLHQTFVNITIDIDFSPFIIKIDQNALPFVCRVTDIHPFSFSPNEIHRMSETIAQDFLLSEKNDYYPNNDKSSKYSPGNQDHLFSLRDSYLISTAATQVVADTANAATHMAVDTSQGLKSAFHQMDTAVNIQSKFKFFQNVFSLPSAELLNECEAFENEAKKEYCNLQHTMQQNTFEKSSLPFRSDVVQPNRPQPDGQAQLYASDEFPSSIGHKTNGLQLYRRETDESKKSEKLKTMSSNEPSFRYQSYNPKKKEGSISQKERHFPEDQSPANQYNNLHSNLKDNDIDVDLEINEGWSDDELDFNISIDDKNKCHQTKDKPLSIQTTKSTLASAPAHNVRSTYDITPSFSLRPQQVDDDEQNNSSNISISSDAIVLEAKDYYKSTSLEFDGQDGIIPTRKRWIRPVRSIFF